jgi:hypothetical protein
VPPLAAILRPAPGAVNLSGPNPVVPRNWDPRYRVGRCRPPNAVLDGPGRPRPRVPPSGDSASAPAGGPSTQGRKPGRAEAWPGRNPADDLRAPGRVEGVLEGGVLLPAVAYRCRIAGMANGGSAPRPRRTDRRARARRTRRDPDCRKRRDRQKRSYTSSHEAHLSIASSSVFERSDLGADATPARRSERQGQRLVDPRVGPGLSASAERAAPGVSGKRLGSTEQRRVIRPDCRVEAQPIAPSVRLRCSFDDGAQARVRIHEPEEGSCPSSCSIVLADGVRRRRRRDFTRGARQRTRACATQPIHPRSKRSSP